MQLLTAYQFDSTFSNFSESDACVADIMAIVDAWLTSKGVSNCAIAEGEFKSLSGDGEGLFKKQTFQSSESILHEITLEELTRLNQEFTTKIAILRKKNLIRFYASLTATNTKSVVAPLPYEARCPKIVRDVLSLNYHWVIGDETKPFIIPQKISGAADGIWLANWIIASERALPIILVSLIDGDEFWDGISEGIAHDLTGLAQVYVIDRDASYAIFEKIGRNGSCYNGAIRLIWPNTSGGSVDLLRSFVWTGPNLLSQKYGENGASKFKNQLRRQILPIAAFSILPPREIAKIKFDCSREKFENLEKDANEKQAAHEFAIKTLEENIHFQDEIQRLRDALSVATTKNQSIESQFEEYKKKHSTQEESREIDSDLSGQDPRPEVGTIQFFKKTHSAPGHDFFSPRCDCGHTNWQSSNSAEKARKGFIRHLGRDDWKSMLHCGTCTGGGVWKIIW